MEKLFRKVLYVLAILSCILGILWSFAQLINFCSEEKKGLKVIKKIQFRKALYVLAIIAFILMILGATTQLLNFHSEEEKELRAIEEIQLEKSNHEKCIEIPEVKEEKVTENKVEENETEENMEEKEKQILPQYASLYDKNNDLYGWISIEGAEPYLGEGYPVMFTPGNSNFYIRRNFDKEDSSPGSILIDGRTTEDTENIIVYGHNMKNGTMFASLRNYKDKSYYEEHKYIKFDTIFEEQTFEIISVSKGIVYYERKGAKAPEGEYLFYEHVELDDEEAFNDYISFMKENSYYDIEVTATYGDQLITLCTCDYFTKNGRLLIVAKKI